MVIIDSHSCIQTVLLCGSVVLGVEFAVCKHRSREVCGKGEGKCVIEVGIKSTVAVIKVSCHSNGVLSVIYEIILNGAEFDIDISRSDRTAVTV